MPKYKSLRSKKPGNVALSNTGSMLKLWLLRMLVRLNGQKEFLSTHGFHGDDIAEVLEVIHFEEQENFNVREVKTHLRKLLDDLEDEGVETCIPDKLHTNIQFLSKLIGLNHTEQQILAFTILINTDSLLEEAADWIGSLSGSKLIDVLSVILDLEYDEVKQALSYHGTLILTGLIAIESGNNYLRRKLELLSDLFSDLMLSDIDTPLALLRGMLDKAAPAGLELSDYPHIEKTLEILKPYLKHILENREKGVNIFIYGTPGTGKTQLARVLAKYLNIELYMVSSENTERDPIDGIKRLRAYQASQSIFSKERALILFDEIEDVFDDGNMFFGRKSTAQSRKAWINNTLENNPNPTIWLSNSIDCLDEAFIRRFDMVFELPIPSRCQRTRLVERYCGNYLSQQDVERIADSEHLSPAIIARANKVISAISHQENQVPAKQLEQVISDTLEAQGYPRIKKSTVLPSNYDPDFINSEHDLMKLTDGINESGSARVCIYGPPGTGKSAFVNWVGQYLNKLVIARKGSDLISMWVGGTEKNIARAFREAEQEGAILLLDEIDSFLAERGNALRNWEVSGVNEMLTQMESYSGIFFATTNLLDKLDKASLRRFDAKMKFDFLKPEQSIGLFQSIASKMNIPHSEIPESILDSIRDFNLLTPGDFAAVQRRQRFLNFEKAEDILMALAEECEFKDLSASKPMGFVWH